MKKVIVQFSSINALMAGLFDGVFSVGEVKEYGDFGLGCSHALAGEVIINKDFLEADGDKAVKVMGNDELLPFVQVTTFQPDKVVDVNDVSKNNLYWHLAQYLLLDNVFVAVKISGRFDELKIRRPFVQHKPYPSVVKVFEQQVVDTVEDVTGTLIGFWTPEFFKELSVAGFHLHFIDTTHKLGGHVIDFMASKAELAFERKQSVEIMLPVNEEYLRKNLKMDDLNKVIKQVEN
ncbi:alpha-acetolactate decarboxylase [Snodgrassella communis]|uniref:acetolactate decarboxylase n=1 Tax=Snodgrassella communis TaxID=2946699 RepID=UPI000C1DE0F3|nr:acetolactate decarboxylase [Snodgrassella communis]PIT22360.1 alpha-acetolactate decarboxylase [Snodgrassella communis]